MHAHCQQETVTTIFVSMYMLDQVLRKTWGADPRTEQAPAARLFDTF